MKRMQTKICPNCGDDIYASAKSHKCGWRQNKPDDVVRPKPHGAPCEFPGCIRWGTFRPEGRPGPWHCFKHYPAIPMPDWFRTQHPEFAKAFRPMSEVELEREAIQSEGQVNA